jgi:hypothetical protein
MEFKAKSTAWGDCNLWKNNVVEFFDLTGDICADAGARAGHPVDVCGGARRGTDEQPS